MKALTGKRVATLLVAALASGLLDLGSPTALAAEPESGKKAPAKKAPAKKMSGHPVFVARGLKGVLTVETSWFPDKVIAGLPTRQTADRAHIRIQPGDPRLPAGLRELRSLVGVTRKGTFTFPIRHIVRPDEDAAVLHIVLDRPKKAKGVKYVYIPASGTPYKGGPMRRAGVGTKPTKAQLKTLEKSIHAAAGDNDYMQEIGLSKRFTNFYPVTFQKKPAFLVTIRLQAYDEEDHDLGPQTAAIVLASPAGKYLRAVEPFDAVDSSLGVHTTLVLAFVDIDKDGTDDILFARNGASPGLPTGWGVIRWQGGKFQFQHTSNVFNVDD